MESDLRQAVLAASIRPEVCAAVDEIYAELMAAIDARRPICKSSGRCCRFEEFGHRLYVSTMELAKFAADVSAIRKTASIHQSPFPATIRHTLPIFTKHNPQLTTDNPGCPFQVDGLCGVHPIRPFGCRIFFCDATSTAWQHDLYERLHGRLRGLHDELGVPYHYVEWRFALFDLTIPDVIGFDKIAIKLLQLCPVGWVN